MNSIMSTFLTPKSKDYISTTTAGRRAQVAIPTIISWCKRYGIGVRVAGRWRIDPLKLQRLLDGKCDEADN